MQVIFMDGLDHAPDEIAAYRDHAMRTHPGAIAVLIDFDGDEAVLDYEMPRVPFERIRRITGYLQKTGQWNNAKKAELQDRVAHQEDELQSDVPDYLNPHRMVGR